MMMKMMRLGKYLGVVILFKGDLKAWLGCFKWGFTRNSSIISLFFIKSTFQFNCMLTYEYFHCFILQSDSSFRRVN